MIAGIAEAFGFRPVHRSGCGKARGVEGVVDHLELRECRPAGELLDCAPVKIARGEIHGSEVAAGAELLVDRTDAFKPVGPVDVRDEAHGGNDVAHGHVGRALSALCMLHDVVDRAALIRQALFQRPQRRHCAGIDVSQPLGELCGEDLRQRTGRSTCDIQLERGMGMPLLEQAVGDRIGISPRSSSDRDLVGETS